MVKRADACAQKADDICYIDNESSYHDALNGFVSKGIDMVIAEEHLAGDLIKFYGIQGTDFSISPTLLKIRLFQNSV